MRALVKSGAPEERACASQELNMGYWTLEILLGSEWERCRFSSEVEARTTYDAVASDYEHEVTKAHLVTPKGVVEQLKLRPGNRLEAWL